MLMGGVCGCTLLWLFFCAPVERLFSSLVALLRRLEMRLQGRKLAGAGGDLFFVFFSWC